MITITYAQAQKLLDVFAGDEEATIVLQSGDGHKGQGLYSSLEDYVEEGSIFLGTA